MLQSELQEAGIQLILQPVQTWATEKAIECEIYINFLKEFIPDVPVMVIMPKDYEENLNEFEKVYHCVTIKE